MNFKGTDIKIVENSNLLKGNNELLFKNGFFDLKNNIFKLKYKIN